LEVQQIARKAIIIGLFREKVMERLERIGIISRVMKERLGIRAKEWRVIEESRT
jgi:hypothetical protein